MMTIMIQTTTIMINKTTTTTAIMCMSWAI
jgi:hypothetical protein